MKNTVRILQMTATDAKKEALIQAKENAVRKNQPRLTLETIHNRTAIPGSTLSRFMNHEDYHPSLETLSPLCKAMDNYFIIQWLAAQCGGYFVRFSTGESRESLETEIATLTKEFSDILRAYGESPADNDSLPKDASRLVRMDREVMELIVKACELRSVIERQAGKSA